MATAIRPKRKSSKPVVLVVDGMNILHRGYFATPQMSNSKGEPTNAIRGFVSILLADIKTVRATHCAVVFDRPGENFRHRLYPAYKAHRPKLDSIDMSTMVQPTREMLHAMGIKVFGKCGIEGDDMIGSIAKRMSCSAQTYIASNDKDFAALVTKHLHLLKPKGVILDEAGVLDSFGVRPDQIIEYLMLIGDTVDNIPGVNKVGKVTAAKLLAQHDTLTAICKNAKHSTKMQANFDAASKLFPLTRQLITIDTSRLKNVSLHDIVIAGPQATLKPLCDELEFRSTYTSIVNTLGR